MKGALGVGGGTQGGLGLSAGVDLTRLAAEAPHGVTECALHRAMGLSNKDATLLERALKAQVTAFGCAVGGETNAELEARADPGLTV
jgi:hypothetical protein